MQTILEKPVSGMVIKEDIKLEPGEYDFSSGQGLIIGASNITIDGNGAVIKGPGRREKKYSYRGTGIYSNGHTNITIKNIKIEGFLLGCKLMNGQEMLIDNNDFSDNYTDPDFGWGDGNPDGALWMKNVNQSIVRSNKGNNVWNCLFLEDCADNTIESNEFAHCHNVCLKLWKSCRNMFRDNVMNYGLRIAPGEVHARDSTSVLIESGSNNNRFFNNDFTHGGDGVFIRSLNNYVSTGNYFEGNDASYAHNNAWEIWDPGNVLINNKGNHSSYGFWLGGSDHTVFVGNEAAYNGIRISNAPESFGNAGVAVVNGSSTHFIMKKNYIHHNKNAGVAVRFKEGYEAFHWIIQQNTITDNETYGIYLKHANWLDIAGNDFGGNKLGDIKVDDNVTDIFHREADINDIAPVAKADISHQEVYAGHFVTFDASLSSIQSEKPLFYRWDLGDGTQSTDEKVKHNYEKPGFYRVSLTVNDGKLSDLIWFDLYVLQNESEIGTETNNQLEWGVNALPDDSFTEMVIDHETTIQGANSIKLRTNSNLAKFHYPIEKNAGLDLSMKERLSFWVKIEHEIRDALVNYQTPTVTLATNDQNYFSYTPKTLDFTWPSVSSEARYGWVYLEIDLNESKQWNVHEAGSPSKNEINFIELAVHSKEGYFSFWIDGLTIQ
ncbi:right-handed parallel beta-helix repeat-containing protein [Fictibacillus fluitans]|uniref:Right-handed parallel beta-helix repeat-containing protein n=1 Tax=Fictibacillus fluitans TaxID=3058422 RepID=A0ABT8I2Y7_9BACL|nr:right-handed parallel beta-helix repeat-containing protein [Fictibacillus sp. NE201]MDN4527403.1 right-handed parallel beta-helix repeat-containing protein [Fictibacillus sp. NE201]